MPFSNDIFTPPNAERDILEPQESASWWLYHTVTNDQGRRVPVITLSIPRLIGDPCTWCFDIALWKTTDTEVLLKDLQAALRENPSAIWEDETIEALFWTVWVRGARYSAGTPLYRPCMSYFKQRVREAPPVGTPIAIVQQSLFPEENQRVIENLRRALASRNSATIEAGVQAYGPMCRQLLLHMDACLGDDSPALKWLSRQFVLKAFRLENDLDKPQTVQAAADLEAWTKGLDFTMKRLADYESTKAPLLPDPEITPPPSPIPASPTLSQRSAPPENENDYERNDAPTPRLPTNPHLPVQQWTNERNTRPPFSPSRSPISNIRIPVSPVFIWDNVDPRARTEIVYDRERLHARGVVTRVYQGVAVHSEPFELVAVKVLTALTGIDCDATLQAWARDEHIREILQAHEATLGDIAYPLGGRGEDSENVPFFLSPWCDAGNLRDYVLVRRVLEPQTHPRRIVLDVMTELLGIVSILHGQEPPIVHGNLKASNILVDGGKLKLCDFGAYSEDNRNPLVAEAQHGIIMHKSLPFMSPELLESSRPTVHSDMWAISCIFIEVHLAAFQPNQDFATWTRDFFGRPLCPVSIGNRLKELITANWDLEPTQRLSASTMHAHLISMRAGSRL